MNIAAILLAAGRSSRFGAADKLIHPLNGIPMALHAANVLASLPLGKRFVVTGPSGLAWPGFEVVLNERPEARMSHSLALSVAAARRSGAEAVLIALADMPLVSARHCEQLLARHHGPASLAASSDGLHRMPPALFGADWFPSLEGLSGDRSARDLLARAEPVLAQPGELLDIDRPEDLALADPLHGYAG